MRLPVAVCVAVSGAVCVVECVTVCEWDPLTVRLDSQLSVRDPQTFCVLLALPLPLSLSLLLCLAVERVWCVVIVRFGIDQYTEWLR